MAKNPALLGLMSHTMSRSSTGVRAAQVLWLGIAEPIYATADKLSEYLPSSSCTYSVMQGSTSPFGYQSFWLMTRKAVLVHSSPQGGTIHQFPASKGDRFLGCYLGTCKFTNDLAEATAELARLEPSILENEE